MLFNFRARFPTQAGPKSLFSFNPLCNQKRRPNLPQALNPSPKMVLEPSSKRPMCPSCSKPSRLCLCNRIKTPFLNNSIAVTILQHSLEQNHPLNSTRIAAIGLKNLSVVAVSDVNLEARFEIRVLESDSDLGFSGFESNCNGSCGKPQNPEGFMDHFVTESQCLDSDSEMGFHGSESNCTGSCEKPQNTDGFCFTIRKSGVISSFMGHLVTEDPNFDLILASSGDLSNGFVVKKWKSTERQEIEEFEIRVPSGSVLLFPSERSVGIEAIDFEVNNLIVLDGTWAKAKRVYSENPWLKLLPHVKLDLGKMSLYGEVRNQPRAGYLSTIESIVYALKAVGDETDGLENLLEVFESMVGDQRRCKDERLSKIALGGP
ncbi:uncharacterized protein LOC130752116 [Actinidia eriantha]|uniref:uncharacterized protein LOC130752116 n=1 Tax=Actinidia eriantha TaxID=165200 RepID=UPI00258E5EAF|nr:uncharacterized protein LOC130752116 [Actinidia eriantha]